MELYQTRAHAELAIVEAREARGRGPASEAQVYVMVGAVWALLFEGKGLPVSNCPAACFGWRGLRKALRSVCRGCVYLQEVPMMSASLMVLGQLSTSIANALLLWP